MSITVRAFAIVCSLAISGNCMADMIFDVAADFSADNNSNGAWSYGYRDSVASEDFTLFTMHGRRLAAGNPGHAGIDDPETVLSWWNDGGDYLLPVVSKNFGSDPVSYFNVVLAPGELLMHPYQGASRYPIIRWTAPSAGLADISGLFYSVTTDGTNTNVHVVFNGASLFDGNVTGTILEPTNASFSLLQEVAMGDTLDLVVGPNAGFGGSTGISATISLSSLSAVPEPSTLGLAFASVGLVLVRLRLRRRGTSE